MLDAHPYQIVLNGESLEELIKRLKSYGLDAIECYYPIHTQEQTAEYLAITEKTVCTSLAAAIFMEKKISRTIRLLHGSWNWNGCLA